MKSLFWVLALLIALLVQATWLSMIAIKGVKPDILLIAVVSTGVLFGKERGIGVGFFAGLLQDLASGNLFGLNILSKMAVGYVFGLAERNVFKENIILPIVAVAVATVLNNIVLALYLFLFRYEINLPIMFFNSLLPFVGYNIIFSVPIHLFIYRWNRRLEQYVR